MLPIFILSKPIQFINALSVINLNNVAVYVWIYSVCDKDYNELVSLGGMLDQKKLIAGFSRMYSLKDVSIRLSRLTDLDLYIEDDRVSNHEFYKKFNIKSLSVFEEGIGTYCKKNFKGKEKSKTKSMLQLLKWKVRGLITGAPLSIGFSPLTSRVYVTQPSLFLHLKPELKSKIRKINSPLSHNPILNESFLAGIVKSDDIVLVAGGWLTTQSELEKIKNKFTCAVYYKPHPHVVVNWKNPSVDIIDSCIPVEFYIKYIATVAKRVTVIHWSSTVEFYLGYISNVNVVDFRDINF